MKKEGLGQFFIRKLLEAAITGSKEYKTCVTIACRAGFSVTLWILGAKPDVR